MSTNKDCCCCCGCCNISNTTKSVASEYPNTEKWVEKRGPVRGFKGKG